MPKPADANADKRARRVCPDTAGGNNYWPASYSQKTKMLYIPANEGCATVTPDYGAHVRGNFAGGKTADAGRLTSSVVMVDPTTGEVKGRKELPYPNFAGVLSTAGGIVVTALLDGTIVALDDTDARRAVARQRRHRLQCAADDLCGQRQAIHRDRVRPVPQRQEQGSPACPS